MPSGSSAYSSSQTALDDTSSKPVGDQRSEEAAPVRWNWTLQTPLLQVCRRAPSTHLSRFERADHATDRCISAQYDARSVFFEIFPVPVSGIASIASMLLGTL